MAPALSKKPSKLAESEKRNQQKKRQLRHAPEGNKVQRNERNVIKAKLRKKHREREKTVNGN